VSQLVGNLAIRDGEADYERVIRRWAERVPREDITVLPFRPRQGLHQLERSFCRVAGITWDEEFRVEEIQNASLSRDCLAWLESRKDMPRYGQADFFRIIEALEQYSREWPDPPDYQWLLPSGIRKNILEAFRESNRRVLEEFAHVDPDLFFDLPTNVEEDPWEPYPGLSGEAEDRIQAYLERRGIGGAG
jgi:hypothetical protein